MRQVAEAYALQAQTGGSASSTASLSAAVDHMLLVARQRSECRCPREQLLALLRAAELFERQGQAHKAVSCYRQAFQPAASLTNAVRFDILAPEQQHKAPRASPALFNHLVPLLIRGVDAVFTW
jgi:hypothetical protein